jgi:hypothetical protein
MEPVSQELSAPKIASALLFCLFAGCVHQGQLVPWSSKPVTHNICQVTATWNHEVAFVPDPVNGGRPNPGIAGRVYLFGPQFGYPELGDGGLNVELFDETAVAYGGQSVLLEQWHFDKDTFQRLQKRDIIGWGYTIFLPWGTYRPDLTAVRLRVRYEPLKGVPIYSDSGSITLETPHKALQLQAAAHALTTPKPPANTQNAQAQALASGGR